MPYTKSFVSSPAYGLEWIFIEQQPYIYFVNTKTLSYKNDQNKLVDIQTCKNYDKAIKAAERHYQKHFDK